MNLVNRALAMQRQKNKGNISDFEAWDAEQEKLSKELDAIDEAAGKGLVVGRVLSYGVADSFASYIITKIRKNDVVVEWVPLYDGYFSNAVWLTPDKRHYIANRRDAEQQCERADAIKHHGK